MTDEHFDEAFERMQAQLNVTPSPEFVVKVRTQNEHAPASRSWSLWAWAGAAAACAAVVIAVAMWRSPAPEPQVEVVHNRPRESASPSQRPSESFSLVRKPTPPPAVGLVPRAPSPAIATNATTTDLEILVPPDQLMGIRRLMSSMRTGDGVPVAPPATLIDPDTGELIKPRPIEIPLITVTPLPGDPEGRSGGREHR